MVTPQSDVVVFASHIFAGFMTNLAGILGGTAGIVLNVIVCVTSISSFVYLIQNFFTYGVMSQCIVHPSSWLANALTIVIVNVIPQFVGESSGEIMLVAIFAINICVLLISRRMNKSTVSRLTTMLAEVEKNPELILEFSKKDALSIFRFAFETGALVAHNWTLSNLLMEKYPKDLTFLQLYVRYASIYPCESRILQSLGKILVNEKHGRMTLKHTLYQIHSLLQQREMSMSKSVKKALGKISTKIERCRGQISQIWEGVMSGNLQDIEYLVIKQHDLYEEICHDFGQLILLYPNSPYVSKQYWQFLESFNGDSAVAHEMKFAFLQLRRGVKTRIERGYFFAIRNVEMLPNEVEHQAMIHQETRQDDMLPEMSIGFTSNQDETGENEEIGQKRYLESLVQGVRLPVASLGPVLTIISICILLPVLIIVIYVIAITNINTFHDVIDLAYHLAMVRSEIQNTLWVVLQLQLVKEDPDEFPPFQVRRESVFSNWDVPEMWESDETAAYTFLNELRSNWNVVQQTAPAIFQSGHFDEAISAMYGPEVPFKEYTFDAQNNEITSEDVMLSFEEIITRVIIESLVAVERDCLESMAFWSVIRNARQIGDNTAYVIESFIEGVTKIVEDTDSTIFTIAIILAVVINGLDGVIQIALLWMLETQKSQVFNIFKSIPKSTISTLLDNLKTTHHHEHEDENAEIANAQEENALRILSTNVLNDSSWFKKMGVLLGILALGVTVTIAVVVFLVMGCQSILGSFDVYVPLMFESSVQTEGYSILMTDYFRLYGQNLEKIQKHDDALEPYMDLMYHVNDIYKLTNFMRISDNGIAVSSEDAVGLINSKDCVHVADLDLEADTSNLKCVSYETAHAIMCKYILDIYITLDADTEMDPSDFRLSSLMMFNTETMQNQFLLPLLEQLRFEMFDIITSTEMSMMTLPTIIGSVVIIILGVIIAHQYHKVSTMATYSLNLLLFCPPATLLSSGPLMTILSNDFSMASSKNDDDRSQFYDHVVSNQLDGVLFLDNTMNILSFNTSASTITGVPEDELISKNIEDVFHSSDPNNSTIKALHTAVQGVRDGLRPPNVEIDIEIERKGNPMTLHLSLNAIGQSGEVLTQPVVAEGVSVFTMIMKDMTSAMAARKLLDEEQKKSEQLLLMILPESIVAKLQAGETNISYAVRSASIMFVDIVSFTPWCGANEATFIMSTLNKMFLEYDRILQKYDRLTKIKCIGDCYMMAGGIFDEINQPAEHARQAVCFGLDIIKALELLNIELDQHLRVRSGVNTGGPIVAGVLGIDKPTFDILGPAICLAQQMEQHGVAMHVHISESTYELVYGRGFRIKEKGDTEVKGNRIMRTYLVSGYDAED